MNHHFLLKTISLIFLLYFVSLPLVFATGPLPDLIPPEPYPNPAWHPEQGYPGTKPDSKPLTCGSVIDLTNGNITIEQPLPSLPSRGLPVMFMRSNLSFSNSSIAELNFDLDPLPDFGRGGAWNYYQHIQEEIIDSITTLALYRGNHVKVVFEQSTTTNNLYESSGSGVSDIIYASDTMYERITKQGMKYVYARGGVFLPQGLVNGKLWYVRDPHGNHITCYWYPTGGDFRITDASGHEMYFLNNQNQKNIDHIEQGDRDAYFYYKDTTRNGSTYSRLTEAKDFAGRSTYYSYDTLDHITGIDESSWANQKTLYEYDDQTSWKISKRKVVDTGSNVTTTWTYGYETATDWKSWVIGPQNDTTYYWYNTITWQMDSVKSAKGHITQFAHDSNYNRTTLIDANGNQTQYVYDNDNLTSVTNALDQTSYYYWDAYSLLTCSVDPVGNRTYYTWETSKRDLLEVKNPLGYRTQFSYDTYGNNTAIIDPLERRTVMDYSDYAQVITIISPSNETTQFTYDNYGNRITSNDPLGHQTKYAYNVNYGTLSQVTDALQGVTNYQYDLVDRLTTLITLKDAVQQKNIYYYDAYSRLTTEKDTAGNYTRYTYNVYGDLTSRRDPNGNTLRYWFNTVSRMTAKECTVPNGSSYGLGTIYFSYDSAGNMKTMNDPNIGMVYWYYDSLNRVTTQICGLGTIGYEYDNAGRQTKLIDPDDNTTQYSYNSASLVYLVKNGFNQFTNYGYNKLGQKTEEWYENSVFADYAYDSSNRLTQIKTWRPTDDFNRADGTNIGPRWEKRVSTNWCIESTKLHIQNSDTVALVLDTTGGTQGVGSSVDVSFSSDSSIYGNKNAFILFGYSSDTDFYYAGAWCGSHKWAIGRYQNGDWRDFDTTAYNFSYERPYRMKLVFPEQAGSYPYRLYFYSAHYGWQERVSCSSTGIPFSKVGLVVCAQPNNTVHTLYDNYILNSITISSTTTYSYSSTYTSTTTYDYSAANNTFTDDFNRADSSNLGEYWTEWYGDWYIDNEQLDIDYNGESDAQYNGGSYYSPVTIAADISCRSDNASYQNGYLVFNFDEGPNVYYAGIDVANQIWRLGNYSGDVASVGDTSLTADSTYRVRVAARAETDGIIYSYIYATVYLWDKTSGQWVTKIDETLVDTVDNAGGLWIFQPGLYSNNGHTRFDNFSINQELAIETTVTTQTTVTVTTTVSAQTTVSTTSTIAQFNYTYDKNGNRTQVADYSNNTIKYYYDTLDRLTTEQRFGTNNYKYTYWYDSVGNRTTMVYNTTTTQYTLNDLNQLTQLNGGATQYNYYYDTNGNLTTQRQASANSTTYFTYDREDRLVQWQYYNPSTTVNYIYCGLGKRVMKVYNNNTALFFFDGLNTILEKYKAYNWSAFSTSQVYTLAPGVVGHIISKRLFVGAPQDLYYHYDPIGNVMFLTDSYGNITVSYVQEGFGNVLATSGSAFDSYHLTTKERDHDPNTGLYYFGARWYDPVIGRFITKASYSPLMEHPYTYAENNPLYFIDPDGQLTIPGYGWVNAGENYGQSAQDYYANIVTDPNRSLSSKILPYAGGLLSSLWTSQEIDLGFTKVCTSDLTLTTLMSAEALSRSFFTYEPPGHGLGPHNHLKLFRERWWRSGHFGPKVPNWGRAKWNGWWDWLKNGRKWKW